MAIRVRYSNLKQIQKDYIIAHLNISPKEDYFAKKRKWRRKDPDDTDGENGPVSFYIYDQRTDMISLPYKYAINLLGRNDNLFIHHPSVNIKFTRQLFETQTPMYQQAILDLNMQLTANLNIYTGAGKTILATALVSYLSKLTLVLVTNTILLEQWLSSFRRFTTAICYIVDGLFLGDPHTNVIICMTSRIHYIPTEWLSLIGTLIIDESHTFCSVSRVPAILSVCPKYIITASATPERDNNMHVMMEALSGTHRIIKISEKPFIVTQYNTGYNETIPIKNDIPDWNALVNMLCEDEYRNSLILDLVKLHHKTQKILILTVRQEHVLYLYQKINDMGVKCDYMTGNKKSYSDSNVLVGTTKKIGTGFDEESACEDFGGIRISRLILAVSIKSLKLLEQVAGRVFRSDFPEIDYLVDDNKISGNHFKKSIGWFTSRNGTVKVFNTPRALSNMQQDVIQQNQNTNIALLHAQRNNIISKIDPSLIRF